MDVSRVSLQRRGRIRVLSFCVAGFLVLGGFTAVGWQKAHTLERFIEYSYQRSFIELVTNVESVDTTLQKGLYATSPTMVAQLSGDITRQASAAQAVMAQLPFTTGAIDNTASFLTRVSDYAAAIGRKAAAGQTPETEEMENLKALSAAAHSIALELAELQGIINEQQYRIGAIAEAEALSGEQGGYPSFQSTFRNMENSFKDLPTLIYDGPFSVHLEQKTPKAIENQQEIGMESAMEKARSILELDEGILSFERENEGKIPSYTFTGHLNGGEISIDITKAGGLPLSMMDTRSQNSASVSVEEAVKKAEEFLSRCGYNNMTTSYWIDTGSALLVNFAYTQNDVVCYPDLIKVGIARDSGEVVQFEAKGFIMNHVENRSFSAPGIDLESAKQSLTPDLTFESDKLCIIPSPGEEERFCHELTCITQDGTHVLIYVNAGTGLEEHILILIEDENGTLAV